MVGGKQKASDQYAELPPLSCPPERVFVGGMGARQAPAGAPRLPGSKYYTLRYLLNALLARARASSTRPRSAMIRR